MTRDEIQEQRIMDFKTTFATEQGIRTLEYISKFCLEHKSSFIVDSERKSCFNEGARSVILEIRDWTTRNVMNTKNSER